VYYTPTSTTISYALTSTNGITISGNVLTADGSNVGSGQSVKVGWFIYNNDGAIIASGNQVVDTSSGGAYSWEAGWPGGIFASSVYVSAQYAGSAGYLPSSASEFGNI
jgi:hypothetical protein